MKRTLSVLGSTGSIGRQTLEVAQACGLTVAALTANRNSLLLEEQARKFRPKLVAAVEESEEIDGLLLLLNTVGGDIEAGLAIAELIAGMKKPTVSLVLGGGHSIGIPLAVSAKRAIIAPRASMTVHPVRMTGLVVGAPQTYHYFDQIQDHIVDFVTENSRISRADFARYMMATGNMATDVGTVLYGAEAVESGLMDQLGSLSDALAYLHAQIAQEKKKRSGPDAGGDN